MPFGAVEDMSFGRLCLAWTQLRWGEPGRVCEQNSFKNSLWKSKSKSSNMVLGVLRIGFTHSHVESFLMTVATCRRQSNVMENGGPWGPGQRTGSHVYVNVNPFFKKG